MFRSKVVFLFVGGAWVFACAPSGESALQGRDRDEVSVSSSSVVAAAKAATLTNAGLKGVESAPLAPLTTNCGPDQVEVEGDYCPTLEQKCVRWMDPETTVPRRCSEFAPTGKCQGVTTTKHFCIDKYEFPNKQGERPVVMKTWYDAADSCKAQGKRLCTDSEWTLACEGQERLPYPYGYERNSQACNIDKPHPDVNEAAMANPVTRDAEVARLWQGENSGSRESCVSPFGAMDMTGNVDEWVINESGVPYKSGLKGGYWGPVRDRCRPMTTAHYEQFVFYQIGFRCCADAAAAGTAGRAPASTGGAAPATKGVNVNPAVAGS
jgi:hypothetical protein